MTCFVAGPIALSSLGASSPKSASKSPNSIVSSSLAIVLCNSRIRFFLEAVIFPSLNFCDVSWSCSRLRVPSIVQRRQPNSAIVSSLVYSPSRSSRRQIRCCRQINLVSGRQIIRNAEGLLHTCIGTLSVRLSVGVCRIASPARHRAISIGKRAYKHVDLPYPQVAQTVLCAIRASKGFFNVSSRPCANISETVTSLQAYKTYLRCE